ncbi:MAG: MFS transporter [Candidatus Latescibacteria bacterium]|nr:MFS transporter [Candidatus Latescibacterota bacterium]NIM21060.1 MFS transporter [Candidatus Latescibacterota bacterium]NIM65195.1 MFS transporter [Candidatus Latescibacterota bacterium]NIO01710.1 MFS transporter [Candidatus Latescibacterota bacterium]NIO28227.1 MFS transporter [Candidatus Latescibacterota bacterium]
MARHLRLCFYAFALAQLISIFGDRLNQFSVVGMVGKLEPGSSVELLKLSLFMHVPILLFAPLFGALLDRWSRAWVLIIVDLLRGIIVALIPSLFYLVGNLYAFYGPVMLLSLANLLFSPAKSAIIPEIVPEKQLFQVNAALWGFGIVATIAGFIMGGWLFDYRSWEWTFYCDAASYLASVLLLLPLLMLPFAPRPAPAQKTVPMGWGNKMLSGIREFAFSIKDGAVLIKESRVIALNLIAQTFIFSLAGWLYVIGIAHLQEVFPPGRTIFLSIAGAAGTVGLLGGSIAASVFRERLAYNRTISVGALLMGVSLIGLAKTETPISLAIWCALMGASVSPAIILTETLLQKHIPLEFRGRVFSAREALTKMAFLGFSIAAAVADAFFDKGPILIALGLFLALFGVVLERSKWARV